jgi:phenylacetate-CoA ligase
MPRQAEAMVFAVLRQMEESQWWPAETILAYQLRQIERLLNHAAATVPFYGERLRFLRGSKTGTLTLETLRRIPILSRADIQEAGEGLTSRKIPADHGAPFEIKTSGSTGRPVKVKGTTVTGLMLRAANLRYHVWFKRDFAAMTACIRMLRGKQLQAAEAGKPISWADGYPSGPMMLCHVATPISEQFDWLLKLDPDYLLTFPSNLLALIRHSEKTGLLLPKLREVATLGEALDAGVREACEKSWKVKVVDAYSSQELGLIAAQCPDHPKHHYHVVAENVLLEVLNERGEPARPGEVGRMVLTDLHNFATPLIRYEIGDLAEMGSPCPCGRGLPMIARVLGRTRNMLVLPSGEQMCPRFTYEDFLFKLPIRQFQVIQENLETLAVRLVADRKLAPEEEKTVRDTILAKTRHPFAIRIDYVTEIPRAASGKFEEFRSEVAA